MVHDNKLQNFMLFMIASFINTNHLKPSVFFFVFRPCTEDEA